VVKPVATLTTVKTKAKENKKKIKKKEEEYTEDSIPYRNFINTLKSPVTKALYRYSLLQFVRYCQLPTTASLTLLPNDALKDKIVSYFIECKSKGSRSGQMLAYAPIKHFCEMNDIILNWKKIRRFTLNSDVPRNIDRAYTHEEIKRVIDYSDHRVGAMFLLLASTGVRGGAMRDIKLKHLELVSGGDSGGEVYKLMVYPGTKEEYITFCTPECRASINEYLEFRERLGERITPESYLFVKQFNKFKRIKARPFSPHSIENLLQGWLVNAGVRKWDPVNRFKRKQIPRLHGFRKFFTTQLVNSKVNPEIREMLLGHSIGLAGAYYRPTEQEMLAEYEKAIDALTIEPSMRLQRKVDKLEVEKKEFEILRDHIAAIEERLASTTPG
jgi:integrase